jgi:hypothetical protein
MNFKLGDFFSMDLPKTEVFIEPATKISSVLRRDVLSTPRLS